MPDKNRPKVIEEAIRYLGVKNGCDMGELVGRAKEIYAKLSEAETPKTVWRILPVSVHGDRLDFGTFEIEGKRLAEVCRGCERAVLLAVTLGASVDRLINRTQTLDMSDAVILDACASAEVERICDLAEEEIRGELAEGESLTMRFSPGYGDVSPEESAKIIDAADSVRKIGLSVTKSGMLVPIKSVTAVIGIKRGENCRKEAAACESCAMAGRCAFVKRGE